MKPPLERLFCSLFYNEPVGIYIDFLHREACQGIHLKKPRYHQHRTHELFNQPLLQFSSNINLFNKSTRTRNAKNIHDNIQHPFSNYSSLTHWTLKIIALFVSRITIGPHKPWWNLVSQNGRLIRRQDATNLTCVFRIFLTQTWCRVCPKISFPSTSFRSSSGISVCSKT